MVRLVLLLSFSAALYGDALSWVDGNPEDSMSLSYQSPDVHAGFFASSVFGSRSFAISELTNIILDSVVWASAASPTCNPFTNPCNGGSLSLSFDANLKIKDAQGKSLFTEFMEGQDYKSAPGFQYLIAEDSASDSYTIQLGPGTYTIEQYIFATVSGAFARDNLSFFTAIVDPPIAQTPEPRHVVVLLTAIVAVLARLRRLRRLSSNTEL